MPAFLTALVVVIVATACAPISQGGRSAAKPVSTVSAVTSTTVLADLIRQVGGERVEVKPLVPSGADPNTYQPAPRDVVTVSRARVVFFNGLGLDRTARTVVNNAARDDLPVITLSDGLPTLESNFSRTEAPAASLTGGRGNPYLWLDARNVPAYVERIAEGLSRVDPEGAGAYRASAAAYAARMVALDEELAGQVATIPPAQRKLVTLHDAFPYLARRYGLDLVGVVIRTPGREPSAREIADISRAIQAEGIRTVFTEPQLNARLLKLAARDAGIEISTLYSDTLDSTVPTYEALLRYNARKLVSGLK